MRGNVDCLEAMLAHGVDAMTKDSSGECAAATHPWLTPGPPQGPLPLLPLLHGAGAEGTEGTATRGANCPSSLWGLQRCLRVLSGTFCSCSAPAPWSSCVPVHLSPPSAPSPCLSPDPSPCPLVPLSPGYTALHLASKHGHPQCVSKLLQVPGAGRRSCRAQQPQRGALSTPEPSGVVLGSLEVPSSAWHRAVRGNPAQPSHLAKEPGSRGQPVCLSRTLP